MNSYRLLLGYFVVALLFIVALMMVGCSPREIVVEKVHTEHSYNTDTVTVKDTVRMERNTIIREARPEDSLLLAQYGIRLKDNERMLLFLQKQLERENSESMEVVHDTTIVRDTIPQIVTVEPALSWWDRKKIEFGEVCIAVLVVVVCIAAINSRNNGRSF